MSIYQHDRIKKILLRKFALWCLRALWLVPQNILANQNASKLVQHKITLEFLYRVGPYYSLFKWGRSDAGAVERSADETSSFCPDLIHPRCSLCLSHFSTFFFTKRLFCPPPASLKTSLKNILANTCFARVSLYHSLHLWKYLNPF